MQNPVNRIESEMENSQGLANAGIAKIITPSAYQPLQSNMAKPGTMACHMVYPEVYYKLQPFVMMVCDSTDLFQREVPTQEAVEQMTDSIYDDVCRMYPDIADYAGKYDKKMKDDPPGSDPADPPDPPPFGPRGFGREFFEPEFFRPRFRRRGMLRDLIDILLLSELTRRRRFY